MAIHECATTISSKTLISSALSRILEMQFDNLGAELGTDVVFDDVSEANDYTSDFSAGADGWTSFRGTAVGNIDAIGGYDDTLRFTADDTYGGHYIKSPNQYAVGLCYRVRFEYYLPSGQSNIDGIRLEDDASATAIRLSGILNTTDAWTAYDGYHNKTTAIEFFIRGIDGSAISWQDAGGDDIFYIKNVIIDAVTFDFWATGTGWAPETSAGALTGKALKTAGTASDLTQSGTAATADKIYKLLHTSERTAGSYTPEFGSTDGAAVSAAGTNIDWLSAVDTDYIKFKADASFAGTIDAVSVKEVLNISKTSSKTQTVLVLDRIESIFHQISTNYRSVKETSILHTVRAPMEAGYQMSRPRYTKARKRFELEWANLSDADYRTLDYFFSTTSPGDSFLFVEPSGVTQYTVIFENDELDFISTNKGYWRGSVNLVEV